MFNKLAEKEPDTGRNLVIKTFKGEYLVALFEIHGDVKEFYIPAYDDVEYPENVDEWMYIPKSNN